MATGAAFVWIRKSMRIPATTFRLQPSRNYDETTTGEADFMQGVADIKDLGGLSAEALSGAFDEPLSKGKVLVITKMFIRATSNRFPDGT